MKTIEREEKMGLSLIKMDEKFYSKNDIGKARWIGKVESKRISRSFLRYQLPRTEVSLGWGVGAEEVTAFIKFNKQNDRISICLLPRPNDLSCI